VFVPYVELHAHTAFSFLDGASSPSELAAAAVEQGHSAMAVVDHNGVSGSMEFAMAAKPLGLRAIHGVEMDLVDGRHVTLLVENGTGWRNLCRIVTRAHKYDREKHEPPPAVPLETLEEFSAGLVLLSGCADHGVHDESTLRRLLDAFGPDHLRVELQRPFQRHDRSRNRELALLAGRLGVPTVATGNVHAHARSRATLQDAFVALERPLQLHPQVVGTERVQQPAQHRLVMDPVIRAPAQQHQAGRELLQRLQRHSRRRLVLLAVVLVRPRDDPAQVPPPRAVLDQQRDVPAVHEVHLHPVDGP